MSWSWGRSRRRKPRPRLGEPNYGYAGHLGSFVAAKDANALALIVVHHYPDMEKVSLGRTKLTHQGPKRLGNIDGWVFTTEWNGTIYPSKIFFSSEKVYFGGGATLTSQPTTGIILVGHGSSDRLAGRDW